MRLRNAVTPDKNALRRDANDCGVRADLKVSTAFQRIRAQNFREVEQADEARAASSGAAEHPDVATRDFMEAIIGAPVSSLRIHNAEYLCGCAHNFSHSTASRHAQKHADIQAV